LLIGLKNDKATFIYIGLFIAVLARPAFTIFVPAFIILEFLILNKKERSFRIIAYITISILGLLCVSIIQFIDTNEWFKFFEAQKNWGNKLRVPSLPLRSWGHGYAIGLDSLAFLIGTISGSFILYKFFKSTPKLISKEVAFSCLYLAGITLSVLLFRGGSLFSLNRFVLATPFIIVAFDYWTNQKINLKLKEIVLIFLCICIFFLLFESYQSTYQFLKFTSLSLFATLFFSIKSDKKVIKKYSYILLIIICFIFQAVSYVGFLNLKWIA
jgi:hypothetical protein